MDFKTDNYSLPYEFMPPSLAPQLFEESAEPTELAALEDSHGLPYSDPYLSGFQREIDHERANHPEDSAIPLVQKAQPVRTITDAKSKNSSQKMFFNLINY